MYKLLLSFTVISDVYRSIPNKIIFTEYCLIQWISKLPGSFEIHWVRQYRVNFMGLAGIVNKHFLQDRANFHRSSAWQIVLIFNTDIRNFIHYSRQVP